MKIDKTELLKKVKKRYADTSDSTSAVFLISGEDLNKESVIEKLKGIDGSIFKYDSEKYKYVLSSQLKCEGNSLNDQIRWLASKLDGFESDIMSLIDLGYYVSVTYTGVSSLGSSVSEVIDPDISKFLADINAPLYFYISNLQSDVKLG